MSKKEKRRLALQCDEWTHQVRAQLLVDGTEFCTIRPTPTATRLALFTPHDSVQTRSVLLCPLLTQTTQYYALIDNLPLHLLFSVDAALDPESLRRFMLRSYGYRHFDPDTAPARHSTLDAAAGRDNDEWSVVTTPLLERLREIDQTNTSDYERCLESFRTATKKKKAVVVDPETLEVIGNDDDDDDNENEENAEVLHIDNTNVDFTANLELLDLSAFSKSFRGERQYHLVLDNHLVLAHFVRRFMSGSIEVSKKPYAVRLIDPVTQRTPWLVNRETVVEQYIEVQITALCNCSYLYPRFDAVALEDGLLWGGLVPEQSLESRLLAGEARSLDECECSPLGQTRGKYRTKLRYQSQFFRLSTLEQSPQIVYWFDYAQCRAQPRLSFASQQQQQQQQPVAPTTKTTSSKSNVLLSKKQRRLDGYFTAVLPEAKRVKTADDRDEKKTG